MSMRWLAGLWIVGCGNPPGAPAVSIEPAEPVTGDDLVVNVVATDGATWTVQWTVDGAPSVEGDTVPASETTRAELWTATVTPSVDGRAGVPAVTSVVIGNTAPTGTAAVDPASPGTDDDLRCAFDGEDADGDDIGTLVRWRVDGIPVGSAGGVLDASQTRGGQRVTCEVTPDDGVDVGATVTSPEAVIGNAAPTVVGVGVGPAGARAGDTLVATGAGFDADGDAVELSYAWTIDGAPAGADPTLTGSFVGGDTVRVEITPFDGAVQGAVGAAELVIADTPPTVGPVTLSPAAPRSGDPITAAASPSDVDGDPVTLTYRWSVDGLVVARGPDATLDGAALRRGQLVAVTVEATSGGEPGAASVVVANSAPSITGASIAPPAARIGDVLTCAPAGHADPDGDPPRYRFAWTVDGIDAGVSAATLASGFRAGDEVVCTVTPSDGIDDGVPATSAALVIDNSPPTLVGAAISPSAPVTTTDLTCAPSGFVDPDGDPAFYSFGWTRGGAPVAGAVSAVLPASEHAKGDVLACTVTPSDGLASGAAVTSAAVVVRDAPPGAPAVDLADLVSVDDDLVCALLAPAVDPDGDPVTHTVAWEVDGAPFVGATTGSLPGDTVPAAATSIGQTWTCRITGHDGASAGPASAATATICDPASAGPDACLTVLTERDAAIALYGIQSGASGTDFEVLGDISGDGIADWGFYEYHSPGLSTLRVLEGPLDPTDTYLDADVTITEEPDGRNFPYRITALGDIDGDGFDDFAAADPGYKDAFSANQQGRIYIFHGPLGGTPLDAGQADAVIEGLSGTSLGAYLAALGDLNGDGRTDFGTAWETAGGSFDGRAHIFFGRTWSGMHDADTAADVIVDGVALEGLHDVVGADMNGDGADDLVLLGPSADYDQITQTSGALHLFLGPLVSGTSLDTSMADATWTHGDVHMRSIADLGDLDADGYDDVLVADPWRDVPEQDAGRGYVIFGSPAPSGASVEAAAGLTLDGLHAGEGWPGLTRTGDLDGDGYLDLFVGIHASDLYAVDGGCVFVWFGPVLATQLDETDATYRVCGHDAYDHLYVSRLGDADGDGIDDLAVGGRGVANDWSENAGGIFWFLQ